MAAIQTTLTLKDDISKRLKYIEKRVTSLAKTMDRYNRGITTSSDRMKTLNKQVIAVTTSTRKLGTASKYVTKLNREIKDTRKSAFSAQGGVDNLTKSVKRLATSLLTVAGVGMTLDTADKITEASNKLGSAYRLRNANASDSEVSAAVQDQLDNIFASAQRSRSSYTDTVQNVGKILINAGEVFDGNVDKAIAFNELMAKSYTIGGASDKEQSSSMYQLIQAMGAGVLAGDELRSVREGAQVAYQYIEQYAQELFNTKKSLKDLASEGLITSEVVANAILRNADSINSMFDKTQVTFRQTAIGMKNNFVKAFEPVLQKLTTLLNNEDFIAMLDTITSAFVTMSEIIMDGLEWIADKWQKVGDYLRENADIISNVLIPVMAGVIAAWLLWGVIATIVSIVVNWKIYLIIAAILILIGGIMWLVSEFELAGQIIGAVFGGIFWFVVDIIASVWNGLVDFIVGVYNFIGRVANTFYNMFNNGFVGFLEGLVSLVWDFVSVIYDAIQGIARLIDTVFGWGLNDAMENFQNKVTDWIDQIDGEKSEEYMTLIAMEDYEGWTWEPKSTVEGVMDGWEYGSEIHHKLSDAKAWLETNLENGMNPFGGEDWETVIGNALGSTGIPDNVGDIADNIELTREDLEYLRELAEMEVINRFTTAEIKVDMSNYNTISGENDLDGLVEKLSEKIEEEMHVVAEGTY